MLVVCDDITVTVPPWPLRVASAATVAPCRISARAAVTPPDRPIFTVPPPLRPDASTRLPAASVTVPVATTAIVPPVVPRATPAALTWPDTMTEPPIAAICTLPVRPVVLSALIRPPASTRPETILSAAAALN